MAQTPDEKIIKGYPRCFSYEGKKLAKERYNQRLCLRAIFANRTIDKLYKNTYLLIIT